jgi:hypothetical protein
MKKLLLIAKILMFATLIVSCTSKESKFLKSAEKYCMSQLNNPKSFSLESIVIADTLTECDVKVSAIKSLISDFTMKVFMDSIHLKDSERSIERSKSFYGESIETYGASVVKSTFGTYEEYIKEDTKNDIAKIKEYTANIKNYKSIIDGFNTDLNNQLKIKDDNMIVKIYVSILFRASNEFGAIVKNDEFITYTPTGGFEMGLN